MGCFSSMFVDIFTSYLGLQICILNRISKIKSLNGFINLTAKKILTAAWINTKKKEMNESVRDSIHKNQN